jgi:hypothetical protein
VQHAKHPQGPAAGLIDDQVGEDSVEQNRPAGDIGPAVTDPRHFGQPVRALEDLRDDPVRRFQSFAFQQVKPDRVDVENGIFGELKGFQRIWLPGRAKVVEMRFPHRGQLPPSFPRPIDFARSDLG